ncbi:MAG: hypothetical protein JMN24_15835 [gamma proteobacterium endosymbiont of Lamellibrachia anaximandri]|nr:hypothetical protein [gamma proteobacterium endosymbiont of Lamellibrachia anaximandri]MBL3619040.1 hypothetical protein [gamma proteobacterium endosymbiont of Lamellibrachia anaximandri]
MSIAKSILNSVEAMPAGQIFGYQELPNYAKSPSAVIKAIGRMVSEKRLERFSKGKFFVPKKGVFGLRKPSDSELIRSILYKGGRVRGYVTGLSLYNKLGLTTQVPRTIIIAFNGGRQEKKFGTLRVKTVVTRIPIKEDDVKLLQYLDVLKDIKKISDSNVNLSLKKMRRYISGLSAGEQKRMIILAMNYYGPQARALVGLILESLDMPIPRELALSLNPTTTYKLQLDQSSWPRAREWNVR